MKIEDIKKYLNKRIKLITSARFSYLGTIESYNDEGINFKDKTGRIKFISLRSIDFVEEWDGE